MNTIAKRIEIDLYSPTSYEVVIAQQGDNISRTIEFVLYNQGEPYIFTDENPAVLAVIGGRRGDHSYFMKECSLKDNIITAVLDSNILYEAGTIQAKIFLYDSNTDTILSTIPFLISVQKDPCDKNRMEAEKSSAFDWLILQLQKLKTSFSSHITDFSNPHQVTKDQVGLGNVPNVTTNDQTPTYEASDDLSELESGETLSSSFGKLSKAVSEFIIQKNKLDGIENGAEVNVQSDWNVTDTESDAYIRNKPSVYTAAEIDNKFSSLETNIDWKESVGTYDEIASKYPNPQDGWTVNVQDTDYTYRYNGTDWIAISANAIPKATSSVDGLFSKEDYSKFESLYNGSVAGVKGNAESTYRTGNVNLTPANIGAAPTSHASTATTYGASTSTSYGHAMASSTTPKANGTAAVGTETAKFARGDHVHPLQTSVATLSTPRTIDGVSFDGSADIAHFGVCATAAATTAKTVSIPGFELKDGARICVMFRFGNTATEPTLNVNSTGAKAMARMSSSDTYGSITSTSYGAYEFVYYANVWNLMSNYIGTDTVVFTSNDTTDSKATSWTSVTALASGLAVRTIIERISTMFKNVRYLYKLLGTTNISAIGDGTVTGILDRLQSETGTLTSSYAATVQYAYNLTTCTVRIANIANTSPVSSNFTIATLPEKARPKVSVYYDLTTPAGGIIRFSVATTGTITAYRYNNLDVYNIGATLTYAI